ncbi:hypothetical protein ACFLXI_08195 [Chloroflexota bacterium]
MRGELKEAVLWFGTLKRGRRQATLLPGPHTMIDDGSIRQFERATSEPRHFFYEPDPAVIRTGMVQNLMVELGAAQVDLEIAYLTADESIPTPFARVWEIEDWFPFQLKRLRAYMRERQVGLVTVKKTRVPYPARRTDPDIKALQRCARRTGGVSNPAAGTPNCGGELSNDGKPLIQQRWKQSPTNH